MKNLVRAFVIALTLTGAAAAAHKAPTSDVAQLTTTTSFLPIPTCPPDDPNGCHIHDTSRAQ